ncbi:MAG: hypothetical protein Fur0037_16350 [Planctomycetota bacterium]
MAAGELPARGLSAGELAAAAAALSSRCAGARVRDAALLARGDDLLLFLESDALRGSLHVALGTRRARVTLTARRFAQKEFARGPRAGALARRLAGAVLLGVESPPGERRCTLSLRGSGGERLRVEVELFSNRGLWAVTDEQGLILEMSRAVETKVRALRTGDRYEPPPARGAPPIDPGPRFGDPVLEAIDEHFTRWDIEVEEAERSERLRRAAEASLGKLRAAARGIERGLREAGEADRLRREADLILAHLHLERPGARELLVPDPWRDGGRLRIALDPSCPLRVQARERYERARRLEQSVAVSLARLDEIRARAAAVEEFLRQLEAAGAAGPDLERRAEALGLLRAPRAPRAPESRTPAAPGFRRFVSAEGYPILVGRSKQENDRLTRTARGNDLWLHIGGGHAGSHVVVRLPRGKTASLETMLDAATLAVHFSKARGAARAEVVYTLAKHVRKPKGMPPGAVLPHHEKTIAVRSDPARLARLLDSTSAANGTGSRPNRADGRR